MSIFDELFDINSCKLSNLVSKPLMLVWKYSNFFLLLIFLCLQLCDKSNQPDKPYLSRLHWMTCLENFDTSERTSNEGNALRNFKELQEYKLDKFKIRTCCKRHIVKKKTGRAF